MSTIFLTPQTADIIRNRLLEILENKLLRLTTDVFSPKHDLRLYKHGEEAEVQIRHSADPDRISLILNFIVHSGETDYDETGRFKRAIVSNSVNPAAFIFRENELEVKHYRPDDAPLFSVLKVVGDL